jgi:hypothetical protein
MTWAKDGSPFVSAELSEMGPAAGGGAPAAEGGLCRVLAAFGMETACMVPTIDPKAEMHTCCHCRAMLEVRAARANGLRKEDLCSLEKDEKSRSRRLSENWAMFAAPLGKNYSLVFENWRSKKASSVLCCSWREASRR